MATHRKQKPKRRLAKRLLTVVGILAVVAVAVAGVLLVHSKRNQANAAPVYPQTANVPLAIVGTTPSSNAVNVNAATPITVALSTPLKPGSPMPVVAGGINGHWVASSPTSYTFVATTSLIPGATMTIAIPGGKNGLVAANGTHLAASRQVTFTVAQASTMRLQQLLAQQGYLPLTFVPTHPVTSPQALASTQPGHFIWRWASVPAQLRAQWAPGVPNTIVQGAIMTLENQHNMVTDGLAGPAVWKIVLHNAAQGVVNHQPYNYVLVKIGTYPQTLYLYRELNPKLFTVWYSSLVNSGIPNSAKQHTVTDLGTFPVYLRYVSTTMSGTNPDGSKYHDEGIPWTSYFNGGDALHGFIRSSYGYPQSLGCIEMPFANAGIVWPHTPIGTLVTIAP